VTDSFEHNNELKGSIKDGEFFSLVKRLIYS
jgi:hypothetical protein